MSQERALTCIRCEESDERTLESGDYKRWVWLVFLPHLNSNLVDVRLNDRRNYQLFQPLLYQVATGSLSPGEIVSPLRSVLSRQKNIRVWLGTVVDVDRLHRQRCTDHPAVDGCSGGKNDQNLR